MHHGASAEYFAISSLASPQRATIDHWAKKHINASKHWADSAHHSWAPIVRDGAFMFRNRASGRLLCHTRGGKMVDTLPVDLRDDSACHWRIIDATTGEICRVLYDSTLSILPPELMGSSVDSFAPLSPMPPQLTLQTANATQVMYTQFKAGLSREHEMILDMLRNGYTALVVVPRLISGWQLGQVCKLSVASEDVELGIRENQTMDPCEN
jgi:hypothetical protein